MKRFRWAAIAAGVVALLIAGAAVFVYGGFYNVAASAPHSAAVEWLLDLGMRRSVAARAPEGPAPDLDDPAMIARGLRHFEANCAECHGGPGMLPEPQSRAMLPMPPDLARKVERFNDNELFWIIRHGLKYTGMPGWPADGRDDEVWAVAAFVRLLPGMSETEYEALRGPAPAPIVDAATLALAGPVAAEVTACAGCHGIDGAGQPAGAFPRLSELDAPYILAQLEAFANGTRPSGIMAAAVAPLQPEQRQALAGFYGGVDAPSPAPEPVAAEVLAIGAGLVGSGDPRRAIPPCAACHLAPDVDAPPLTGQVASYLAQQLFLFRAGTRQHQVMSAVAEPLTDEEIGAVAAYFAALRR